MHPYLAVAKPHLFAHRGASGVAPENTLPAFARADEVGVAYFETDCHATRDGEIVLCHDPSLERTTNGAGPISAIEFRDLERLDAGYRFTRDGHTYPFRDSGVRIPRLLDILEQFPHARINLEIKQAEPPIVDEVIRLLVRTGAAARTLLAAEHEPILAQIRARDPGTALGSSRDDVFAFFGALDEGELDGFRPRGHALQIPLEAAGRVLVTAETIAAAARVGLAVHVWTINEPSEIRRLLAMGVDGVMSDYPDRLLAAARAATR